VLCSTQLVATRTQELVTEQQQTLEAIRHELDELISNSTEQTIIARENNRILRSLQGILMRYVSLLELFSERTYLLNSHSELAPLHRNMLQLTLDQEAKLHQESQGHLLRFIRDLPNQIMLQFTIPPQVLLQ
jgi:hypothetical protein